MSDLRICFYGDDFTGSTDALESLSLAGVKTALFLEPPSPAQLARFDGLQAVGVAGRTRSMRADEIETELASAFERLKALGAPFVHYKICSTFDSSPEIGSIGRAIDVGARIFKQPVVLLIVGAPALGRYCVFGNLFARAGLDTEPYRLDRHPAMRGHVITPMDESDLRVHLARQTERKIGLFDVLALELPEGTHAEHLARLSGGGNGIVLFDLLYEKHLPAIGRMLDALNGKQKSLFVVGSSAVGYALTAHWRSTGFIPAPPPPRRAEKAAPVAVFSGSCSPVTDRQIEWALEHGFHEIALRADRLADPAYVETELAAAVSAAERLLKDGKSVILHTARNSGDSRIEAARKALHAQGRSAGEIGAALGQLLRRLLERHRPRRVAVVGGDTSGCVAWEAGIEALEMIATLAPGSPLCRVHSADARLDGLEITFKGGQVGKTDFFGML